MNNRRNHYSFWGEKKEMKSKIILISVFYILLIALPFVSFVKWGPSATSSSASTVKSSASASVSSSPSSSGSERQFKILDEKTGEVFTVSDRDYVCGSVASEMPADYPAEALKAQAVASYTYAVMLRQKEMKTPTASLKGAYFIANPSEYKVYIGKEQAKARFGTNFDANWGKITTAVDEVFGTVAVCGGAPITAAYFSVSAGKTESSKNVWGGDATYLVPVVSSWDTSAPGYASTADFSTEQMKILLTDNLSISSFPDDRGSWFAVSSRSDSGTVLSINVCGKNLSGVQVRKLLGLRSADFTVSMTDNGFSFSVVGYGHNVGMSQYGARCMALEGKTWQEILKHYYTRIDLVSVNTIL